MYAAGSYKLAKGVQHLYVASQVWEAMPEEQKLKRTADLIAKKTGKNIPMTSDGTLHIKLSKSKW